MDTFFINTVLLFAILAVLLVYLYQNTPTLKTLSNNSTRIPQVSKDSFMPIIWDTCKMDVSRKGMPVHHVGPVYNFHQHFNKYSPSLTCNNPSSIPQSNNECISSGPSGIPEMGWRNFYLSNFSKNEIKLVDPFAGTNIRNYLNNMENVDNIYRKC